MTPDELTALALARNDRYLREFVEPLEICPFARRCRETGGLERRVVLAEEPDPDALAPHLKELAEPRFEAVEVALLILPRLQVAYPALERLAGELRARTSIFFVVAFHPEAPMDTTSPDRLVTFLRRSPDPTLQLVRVSILDRVRGSVGGTVHLGALPEVLPEPSLSLSRRIARAGHDTIQRAGAETLRSLLAGMRGPSGG